MTSPQKTVHVCTLDSGGASRAAYRLHKGLQVIGEESTFLVGLKHSDDPSVVAVCEGNECTDLEDDYRGDPTLWDNIYGRWQTALEKYPHRVPGQEVFSDTSSTYNIFSSDKILQADVVNLHWVAGILDYRGMQKGFSGKTIIWTLHDMNPFTGGCHYAGTCTRYKESCGSCPLLASDNNDDLSHRIWKDKQNAYKNLKLIIVTPSRWLAECARSSSLFKNFPVHVIPNGIPLDVYHPHNKSDARKSFNISENARIILFGADMVSNRRKGFSYLVDALRQYNSPYNDDIILVTFGKSDFTYEVKLKFPLINLGSIEDETKLAAVYSMSDVFVLPSLEDNLPNTVLEALACGVPVVCFNIGGMPDMIDHKQNGYLACAFDVADLAQGIQWGLERSQYKQLAESGVINMEPFSLGKQAATYSDLYNTSLRNGELNSKIIIATSIAPKNIEQQKSAVTSWLQHGFEVISVNTASEIAILIPNFPEVTFVETKRDARETMGRPLIFLDDVFAALKLSPATVCGIINSDIHLRSDIPIYDFVASEAKDSFICGHRYDVEDLSATPGKLYLNGYDIFFFDKSMLDSLPPSPFCLGATWWDIWVPLAMILKNVPAKRIVAPLGFHVLHTNRWDEQEWLLNSIRLVKLIDSNQFDLSGCPAFTASLKSLHDRNMLQGLYKLFRDVIFEHTQLVAPEQMLPEGIDPALQAPSYLVSAIVSTYNAEKFFSDCISNLIGQSLYEKGQLEIIIINSGSEQNEERIAQYYMENHDHIVYQRTERETLYAAWNRGIKLARGRYITHANTDDRHQPNAFERMAHTLERHDVGLVYVDALMTTASNENYVYHSAGKAWLLPDFNIRQALLDCPFGCQVMWKRSVHEHVGMFDASYKRAGDYEFFLRVALKTGAIHLPETLALYHESPDNLSYQAPDEVIQEVNRFIGAYRRQLPLEIIYPYLQHDSSTLAKAAALVDFANNLMGISGFLFTDTQLAEAFYRQALGILPHDADILGNLVVACIVNGNISESRSLIHSATNPSPRLTYYKDMLADERSPELSLTRLAYPGLDTMQAVKTAHEIRIPWKLPVIDPAKKTIIIDGVIFQLQNRRPFGISRMWLSLLSELGRGSLAARIILLDRVGTAPKIPGIQTRRVPVFHVGETQNESVVLDAICREENAELFLSTYYTYTNDTPSLLMLYDMIPERFDTVGPDIPNPEWRDKYHSIMNSSAFAAISHSTARDLGVFYSLPAQRPLTVVPCAVSDEFRTHSEEEIAAFKTANGIDRPYFLLVGRRDPHKNAELFFRAFSQLPDRERYAIVMAGGGDSLEPELRNLAGPAAGYAGFFSDQDLSLAYSCAIALVYPSIYEGFGLPILEAMQSGCPVITCQNSSLPEVAGSAALFVGEYNHEEMTQALVSVQQPDVRGYLAKRGLERARFFSWQKSAELLADAIQKSVGVSGTTPTPGGN